MENISENYFDETYDLIKNYTDDRILLLKIQAAKKTAKITSSLVFIFIVSILSFFALMFFGFMLAYFFSEKMGSTFYGFSIVAAIYVFLLVIFMVSFKSYFSKKIMNMVTNVFFENDINNMYDDEE